MNQYIVHVTHIGGFVEEVDVHADDERAAHEAARNFVAGRTGYPILATEIRS